MSTVQPSSASGEPIYLQFDDNRLLPLLFGEHDRHLVQIEQALGVSLVSRGNQIVVSGPRDAVDIARAALSRLYQRLEEGESIDPAEVDGAVRMATSPTDLFGEQEPVIQTRRRQVGARTPMQAHYIEAMQSADLVFGLGPAGTGKTYLAVCFGVAMLLAGKVDRIILSRPAVEAGERLGYLPGDMREKVDPYLRPIYDALYDTLPADQVTRRLDNGDIEIAPLAFMRGRTLKNAFVLLDEGQNTTPMQMKMFLTRLGENSRMVVTGDLSQIDLPPGARSGLTDALDTLRRVEGIRTIRFGAVDVVRHPLVSRIVTAYDKRDDVRRKKPDGGADGS